MLFNKVGLQVITMMFATSVHNQALTINREIDHKYWYLEYDPTKNNGDIEPRIN